MGHLVARRLGTSLQQPVVQRNVQERARRPAAERDGLAGAQADGASAAPWVASEPSDCQRDQGTHASADEHQPCWRHLLERCKRWLVLEAR